MNTSILQRLSFLFTLLCLTALAVHPGAAAAAAKDDQAASAAAPSAPSDDDFNDDSDQGDRSDWRNRIELHRRHNSQHHEDGEWSASVIPAIWRAAKRPIPLCRYSALRPVTAKR